VDDVGSEEKRDVKAALFDGGVLIGADACAASDVEHGTELAGLG
jgi:hypothetical protein